jgi:hypothetical protein
VTRTSCLISCVADVDTLWTNIEVLAVATTPDPDFSGRDLLSYNAANDRTDNPACWKTSELMARMGAVPLHLFVVASVV